jgi:prevent-host-death family protein
MESIGAFDAKTRFSELLARAARGETFVITKHGRPMARLTPEAGPDREKARAAAERLKALRGSIKGVTLEELCEDIHAGHRF